MQVRSPSELATKDGPSRHDATKYSPDSVRVCTVALPGCYSQGESVEEALGNVKEAIELYLEALRDKGQDAPNDADVVFQVSVTVQPG